MLLIKNGKVYDAAKYVAQVVIPAVGTLYFALAQTWGFSNASEVVGSLVAVDTFLGVVLHLSSTAYNSSEAKYDGTLDVTETDDKKSFMLNVNDDIYNLDQKDELVLKIQKKSTVAKKVKTKKSSTSPKK